MTREDQARHVGSVARRQLTSIRSRRKGEVRLVDGTPSAVDDAMAAKARVGRIDRAVEDRDADPRITRRLSPEIPESWQQLGPFDRIVHAVLDARFAW
ncbi:MAG: hypothetical protein AAGF23_15540 [Acidobacteriota bacterium]